MAIVARDSPMGTPLGHSLFSLRHNTPGVNELIHRTLVCLITIGGEVSTWPESLVFDRRPTSFHSMEPLDRRYWLIMS